MTNPNDSAFPLHIPNCSPDYGISIRAYLAAKAMAAIIQGTAQGPKDWTPWKEQNVTHGKWCAMCAVEYADALIAELNKGATP